MFSIRSKRTQFVRISERPPKRSLSWLVHAATLCTVLTLSACGGTTDSNNDPNPTTPPSVDGGSTGSEQGNNNANVANGQTLLSSQMCNTCHQDTGQASVGVFGGIAPYNMNALTYQEKYTNYTGVGVDDLAAFISTEMPLSNLGSCDTQCGQDIAAYLWTLRDDNTTPPLGSVSCDTDAPVYYGQRGLKLLASYEYHNSLQALFNLPLPDNFSSAQRASVDSNIGRLPNQKNTVVNDARHALYDKNAEELAVWAMENPAALPFSCDNYSSASCADSFISQFATLAYRRPLNDEEKSIYNRIITTGLTPQTGMKWAIRTTLGSAPFLYRSEVGELVSQVKSQGWGLPAANFDGVTRLVNHLKIEAEDYTDMSGIQTENTDDRYGGLNVGYIDDGDWLDYKLRVTKAGTYTIAYRVASLNGGGQITLQTKDDLTTNDLASIDIPSTGDWQNWITLTHEVELPAGLTTLRLLNKSTTHQWGHNINWLTLSTPEASRCAGAQVCNETAWGFDLEGDTGFVWGVNGGSNGGNANIYLRVAVPKGSRAMSLWVNGAQVGIVSTSAAESPVGTGSEIGPFPAELVGGNNTVELRDTEGTAEFNVHYVRVTEFNEVMETTYNAAQGGGIESGPEQVADFIALQLADDDAYVLTPYEYASALSYMYTASSPDITLLAAAENGELNDASLVQAHIIRMLDSDLGRQQVQRFIGKWLKTDGVTEVTRNHPRFTDEVKSSMATEVRKFYEHIVYNGLPFSELLSANYTFLNSTLSDFYGIPGGGNTPDEFNLVSTANRGGVITSGAFMAFNAHKEETAPIVRSVKLRQNLLCQEIPPPPKLGEAGSDRDANLQEVEQREREGTLTTTDKYDLLTKAEGCGSCHNGIINPLFGMDDFDHVGLPRRRFNDETVQRGLGENGLPDVAIDWINRGVVYGLNNIDDVPSEVSSGGGLHFNGAKDLSSKLASEPAVANCFIERAYRFATGYPLNASDDTVDELDYSAQQKSHAVCVTQNLKTQFNAASQSPYALLQAIGLVDVIRFKKD